jgi:hypothetical protein
MKKMAIFVEGQTEQLFAETLVTEVAGRHNVHIDTVRAYGGSTRISRTFLEVTATSRPDPGKKFYVIIYDSSNDSRVVSDIIEMHGQLVSQGFEEIVGIRDVYPLPSSSIPAMRSDFATRVPAASVQPILVLSVMEIEAWFIAEHTHFERLNPALNSTAVTAALGYNPDPQITDSQQIPHPADDLARAYAVARLPYNKSRRVVQQTVSHLDYPLLYAALPSLIPDLATLTTCLDQFMA